MTQTYGNSDSTRTVRSGEFDPSRIKSIYFFHGEPMIYIELKDKMGFIHIEVEQSSINQSGILDVVEPE